MGFWEVVQWWEEWQLRILVLMSFFLQCFLCFAGSLRKRCIPSWLRFLIWMAYISSDVVAIYGLATLFNRQKTQESTHESSAILQVLWTPILLIHLGGQDGITAYNIEDNELWRRHVLTGVSQVAFAVFGFHNSLPQDRKILVVGVLLFVVGTLKCILKPWDLKMVSINSLINSAASKENHNVGSLDKYIQAATEHFRGNWECQQSCIIIKGSMMWMTYDTVFIDLTPSYSYRLSYLEAMVLHSPDKVHGLVRCGLSVTFDRLYTKVSVLFASTKLLCWISIVRLLVTTISLLFVIREYSNRRISNNEAYNIKIDAKITLLLIGFIPALELISKFALPAEEGRHWPDEVAQYNLLGYLARNKKHKKIRRLAALLVCKDYIDQLLCMKSSKSSSDITMLVHSYIAQAWTEHHIKDMATYIAFNDNRGQWTLNQEGCGDSLNWSLERPFDESVLLWHLATDFCFHQLEVTPPFDETARRCRVMSNYMLYLLFVNPEMLMTGARRSLFKEAYRQLKEVLKLIPEPEPDVVGAPSCHDESEFARKISQNIQQASATVDSFGHGFTYLGNAWRLAQQLKSLCIDQDDAKMWNVIQGVWVEMLCFSAGRCRGYLHAKSLGKGGEYLSYIWLLMSYMGMETLAERMQRPKLKEEDARKNDGSSNGTTTTASSSSIATATSGNANGTTAAIPAPATAGGHGDGTTEASTSTPVLEGGDADETIPASPVMTRDPGSDGRIGASR